MSRSTASSRRTGSGSCCPGSDVVVLCASLNRTTRHLIGPAELATMKPTALLVNVARGALVDEAALDRALRSGRLRGAMLDVTEREPLPRDSPLWTTPNLLLTPHVSRGRERAGPPWSRSSVGTWALYLAGEAGRMGNLVDYGAVR
ncbi:MAG: NAD(P)-dependent oxidoreductase [Actinomycetota bacterium]